MITFKLGFLLGLSDTPSKAASPQKARKGKGKGKKSKSGKSKTKTKSGKSGKSKKSKKSTKTASPDTEKQPLPEYAFIVDKPVGFFHIEYSLFPHLERCHIDVLHWITFSKIYFQSNSVIYKNMIRGNTIWIPIMLEHKLTTYLTEEQLRSLKYQVIEILVTPNKKKMSARAKNEKVTKFFIKSADLSSTGYVEAFEYDPNIDAPSSAKKESISYGSKNVSYDQPLISIIKQFDESLLDARFQKILSRLEKGEEITINQYVPSPPKPLPETYDVKPNEDDANTYVWPKVKKKKSKGKGDKKKKGKGSSKKSSKKTKATSKKTKGASKKSKASSRKGKNLVKSKVDARIKVSAESFLTHASLCTHRLNETVDDINDLFVVMSTTSLTRPSILCHLNPFVIRLKSIRNLPVDFLLQEKFASVYLEYNIPNIARHITKPILLEEVKNSSKIKIQESHVFFDIPLPDLSYFAACDRLFVDMIGVYNQVEDVEPYIYGSLKSDFVPIPVRPREVVYPKPESLVLAVACFDLSLLLHSILDLTLIEPFRHPTNCSSLRVKAQYANEKFLRPLTIEQIHLNFSKNRHPSPLFDGVLVEYEPALKMHVSIACKLDPSNLNITPKICYERLLLIVYDISLSRLLVGIILNYNIPFCKNVILQNYLTYDTKIKGVDRIDPNGLMVTGFWIDNGASMILFMEASRNNHCMQLVYQEVKEMNESICRYYYNSRMYFRQRIYENFVVFGGVYKITLKCELQKIFEVLWTHSQRSVPKQAWEAIQKIENLLKMRSMQIMRQHAMFPTVNELISFDMEFGVPHHIQEL